MKKLALVILLGSTGLFFTQKTEAAEFKILSEEQQQAISDKDLLNQLGEGEKLVRLPNGGFANGEVIFYENSESPGVIFNRGSRAPTGNLYR